MNTNLFTYISKKQTEYLKRGVWAERNASGRRGVFNAFILFRSIAEEKVFDLVEPRQNLKSLSRAGLNATFLEKSDTKYLSHFVNRNKSIQLTTWMDDILYNVLNSSLGLSSVHCTLYK